MPFADYVPQFNDGNVATYYRSVLGVPVRKRVVIAVLTVLVLLLIFVISLVYTNTRNVNDKSGEVSVLPYVKIANSVNLSVDPCVNFYEFACGLWSEDELVKNDEDLSSTFDTLNKFVTEKKKELFLKAQVSDDLPRVVNDALRFYHTCMSLSEAHEIEIEYFMKYIRIVLGGWPILNVDNWDGTNFNWINVSAYLLRTLQVKTILEVSTIIDDINSSRRVLYISPPVFEDTSLSDFSSIYVLSSVFECLNHSDVKIKNVRKSVDAIKNTEKKWLKIFTIKSGLHQNRTRMTVQELREKMPSFDWLHYVQLVFNDTHGEYSEDDIVYVDNFEFLNDAIAEFESESFSKFEMANLFGWFILQKIWFIVPGAVRVYSQLYGESEEQIKENADFQCWKAIDYLYDCSIDYLFVQNISHFSILDGEILLKNVKNALEEQISHSAWLDESTKSSAVAKLKSMASAIGFKKYLTNKSEFDKLYQNFPSFSSCVMQAYFEIRTYFTTFMVVNEIKFRNYTDQVTSRSITDVSAYYEPQRNTLTIPLSMFNPPFYYYGGPWYLNFGGIGSIIAHEVMHGFDSVGGKRDKTGALKNWWSNSTLEKYKHRSECFETQYNAYKELNIRNNTIKSVGEDIGDSEGLRLAYLAYTKWMKENGSDHPYRINKNQFSPEQTFFIAFASVWCSKSSVQYSMSYSRPMDRVIGAISNSDDFSRVFNCPVNSPMNPSKKCHIWWFSLRNM